jgi:hypothetical protein
MASNIIAAKPAATKPRKIPEGRAGVIFGEIADIASSVSRLGVLIVAGDDEDPRDRAAYEIAIVALSNQIGLLADIGARECGAIQTKGSDPAQWLLPLAFHQYGGQHA